MTWQILRDHRATPWKNGGGTTYQVAASPDDASLENFDWRISFAEATAGGPFSVFAGVDRIIALVDGGPMSLTVAGQRHELPTHVPFAFPGDSVTTCDIGGAARDLNVMTRRGRAHAEMRMRTIDSACHASLKAVAVDGESLFLVVVSGSVRATSETGESVSLGPRDVLKAAGAVQLHGDATVADIRIHRTARQA